MTLHDIVHTEKSLTLVFEYLEKDLKQYMDDCGGILAMNNVKVFNRRYNDNLPIFDQVGRTNALFFLSLNSFRYSSSN